MILRTMFRRRWWATTLLVVIGSAVCVRLGIWQLDRLDARRAFNLQVKNMRSVEKLDLNHAIPQEIETMEWRSVTVRGVYDFDHQIALRNQYNGVNYGYHLITPLRFGETAVLVDRGWIPAEGNRTPVDWRKYDEQVPLILVGQIRLGQEKPGFGGVADPDIAEGGKLDVWNNLDVARIILQLPYPALNIYIQPNMNPQDAQPPIPFQPEIELTEGSHMGYALQWFAFAAILFFGYPVYLRRQEKP